MGSQLSNLDSSRLRRGADGKTRDVSNEPWLTANPQQLRICSWEAPTLATTTSKPKVIVLDRGDGPPDLLIAELPRGERARLRVTLGEFAGQLRLDCRVWRVMSRGPEFKPTGQGVCIRVGELEAVAGAMADALVMVREKRPELLDPPG